MLFPLLLTGCAGKLDLLPGKTTPVEFYPECYAPIQALRDAEKQLRDARRKIAGAVTGGAITGGLLAGGIAALRGGSGGTIAAAAAGGAIVGGGAGYALARNARDTVRTSSFTLDQAISAARAAQQCYSQRFDSAVADYKAQRISKELFERRSAEIIAGMEEAGRLLQNNTAEGRRIQEQYEKALASGAKEKGLSDNDVAVLRQSNRRVAEAKHVERDKRTAAPQPGTPTRPQPAQRIPEPVQNAETRQVAAKVGQENFNQLQAMAEDSVALELTLSSMEAEQALHRQRLAAMAQTKNDIMI